MSTKKWYKSKMLWANGIMLAGLLLQGQLGFTLSAEEGGAIIIIVNAILRLITKSGLEK